MKNYPIQVENTIKTSVLGRHNYMLVMSLSFFKVMGNI